MGVRKSTLNFTVEQKSDNEIKVTFTEHNQNGSFVTMSHVRLSKIGTDDASARWMVVGTDEDDWKQNNLFYAYLALVGLVATDNRDTIVTFQKDDSPAQFVVAVTPSERRNGQWTDVDISYLSDDGEDRGETLTLRNLDDLRDYFIGAYPSFRYDYSMPINLSRDL